MWSPCGRFFATASSRGTVSFYQPGPGPRLPRDEAGECRIRPVLTISLEPAARATGLSFSRKGGHMLLTTGKSTVPRPRLHRRQEPAPS